MGRVKLSVHANLSVRNELSTHVDVKFSSDPLNSKRPGESADGSKRDAT